MSGKISEGNSQDRRWKGRLKIFLGMSAGVGKTYTMLETAQKKQSEGVDLLVGIVETHGRPETAKLLEALPKIPLKTIIYKEKEFKELDVETIIQLKPQLVLVDELAHTNVPGSKHLKRWQDVEEFLECGIDVYTTLNIQHIESYKDVVEKITDIQIRETVPDALLEVASEIEFVDITPVELLQRLREGKVYTGELSAVALQNFFQEERLTALREIALRCTAEKVEHQLHEMFIPKERKLWTEREKLLVAINHQPYAQYLIRNAKRLSSHLHAPLIVLYVDSGEGLSELENSSLAKNFSLARELGAQVLTTKDADIAQAILRIAAQEAITQIIIGRQTKKRLSRLLYGSLASRLSKNEGISVLILKHSGPILAKESGHRAFLKASIPYFQLTLWASCFTILSLFLVDFFGYKIVGIIYLLSILLLTPFFMLLPLFFLATLSFLLWDFFFIPEVGKIDVSSAEDIAAIVLFFIAALIGRFLTSRIKRWQQLMIQKERTTEALYEIVKDISSAPTLVDLIQGIKKKIGEILQGNCEIIIQKADEGLNFEGAPTIAKDEKERGVATWVYENGKEAGWSTATLSSSQFFYMPLKGFREIVGVLAFQSPRKKSLLPEDNNFIYTVGQQLAYFLERSLTEERELKNRFVHQLEEVYVKILHSISNELYSPLQMIENELIGLKKSDLIVQEKPFLNSVELISQSTDTLLRIAENAKEMAKLSVGAMTFKKAFHDVQSLIEICCKEMEETLINHRLKVHIQENIPQVPFDLSLMTILLRHLIYNATQFSPPQTTIKIMAEVYNGSFVLAVSDEGEGIPEEIIDLIFEKFYRVEGTATAAGLGLGLAIVKSIAEIHNGSITVLNRPTGGATFTLILPL